MDNKNIEDTQSIKNLKRIVSKLRDPQNGCPWDLKQTNLSLIPYLIEEAYEVADAIRHGNDEDLSEELGDLLLQIILHAQIASEKERFDLENVIDKISKKLIRRHPHIFHNKEILNSEEANISWEKIKKEEKSKDYSSSPISDELRLKIRSQSALNGAIFISKKTACLGFEWDSIEGVLEKVDEELQELKDAIAEQSRSHSQDELGDLLFTLINVARWLEISPEEGLAGTNQRFLDRFTYIEKAIDGDLSDKSLQELQKLWGSAKTKLDQESNWKEQTQDSFKVNSQGEQPQSHNK